MSLFETEVEIKTEDNSKTCLLHQRFFVNKIRKVSWCYGMNWKDSDIIADLNKSCKYPDEIFILKVKE